MAARPPSLDGSPPELAGGQPRANHRPEPIAASRAYGGVRFFRSVVCTGLMAYGEHWPELRRPGAGVDRQQNQRLVAAQIKDQLSKAQVPLLGTVLAERRFPVPQGL